VSKVDATEARRQRGLAIAQTCRIVQKNGLWIVPSQTGNGSYHVHLDPPKFVPACTCDDYATQGQPCKHVFAARFAAGREKMPAPAVEESEGQVPPSAALDGVAKRTCAPRPTYKQVWPAYDKAQVNEKRHVQALLADLCRGIQEPPRKPGRGRKPLPMADQVFAAVFKVYSSISARRFMTDLSEACDKGYIAKVPHYSTIAVTLEDPFVTPTLRALIAESARPLRSVELDYAVDSSGFSTSRFIRWFDHKYGKPKQKYDWVKVSLMTGVKTNVVTAVEIDERYAGDCPKFGPLTKATKANGFTIRQISADAAYLSYDNMDLVAELGGTPYIAFPVSTTAAQGGMLAKMFHLYNLNREDYLAHYHKRSNVETTFSMIKAKFGDSLRSKSDTAMVNEALAKVLCHNLCCLIQSAYELGVAVTFWGKDMAPLPEPGPVPEVDELISILDWV
jgi:transposase